MANKYIKELSALTQLASTYGIEIDTGSSSGHVTLETLLTYNNRYKISPSVSSNDLVLAINTVDGNDPSTTDAIPFKIGNTIRWCTSALSVTKADGTNWANLGSAELGTKEHDLFVYVVWNTNTSAVDIFWSRIPYGRLYSDFSSTTTNQSYAAINSTAPASTDECTLIGRFAATLSLSGTGYLWTVPTYTNINLIHHPIYETRRLTWQPTITGYSSNPTGAVYEYYAIQNRCHLFMREATAGTSNLLTKDYTAPFTAATITNMVWAFPLPITYDNATVGAAGRGQIASASNSISFTKSASGAWTASGSCYMPTFQLIYEI